MSLSKQLGLGFFFVLTLVFIGTLWMNTQNTRSFLESQLTSHAQDTATSLGLSITPYIGNEDDLAIIETMINAIYDRGFYASIELHDTQGNVLIERSQSTRESNIPEWFVQAFRIVAPVTTSEVNDGWTIKGSLKVIGNPSAGYEQLWQNAVQSLLVTAVAFIIALFFTWFLVKKVISQPINRVIAQADAISRKQFEKIEDIPTTKELYDFVRAINGMSEKLFLMFRKLSNQSEEYRRFAYADLVTGVGNRRAFELAITQLLNDKNNNAEGFLFLVRAASLKHIHTELGGDAGDRYLKSVCQAMKEAASAEYDHFSIFRVNGGDFALIIENLKTSHAKAMAKLLAIYTKRLEKTEHQSGVAFIAGTQFNTNDEFKSLMERADAALLLATQSQQRWAVSDHEEQGQSNEMWRERISQILKLGNADFVAQSILGQDGRLIYNEWFARIHDVTTNETVPMAQLIPASIRLDNAQDIDKLIIQNVLMNASDTKQKVGLNISRISLFDANFVAWFLDKLSVYRSTCPYLVLEIPERALVHDIESLVELTKTLKSYGVEICVEHFGAQLAGVTHMRRLMPDYLKIDGRFTRGIEDHPDNQLFVKSLIHIANGLDIKVLAEMIETQYEQAWLMQAGVDGLQGYFISGPKNLLTLSED
ncbi:EAL domain-containing protein [Glaciecola sp. XM2]|jgi:diguanylate cyclase (GGDEF)-like protein|uniref:bifunctional diguanylate cyclase/phosphodiesterase n=1 Tax=Glaciecola sp. XM2 TaxID=1914931 RepID=UPI001BDE71D7|nr:EAL domain-containing protein [Glaciecola sp. XM2]MBT1452451.1 EAL domain-containing protein [Glaciecola sp. XM2]